MFVADENRRFHATQFHMEVVHTPDGEPHKGEGLPEGMAIAQGTGFTHRASGHVPSDASETPGAAILGSYTQADEAEALAGLTPEERRR